MALVLYVYLPGTWNGEESCLTVSLHRIPSQSRHLALKTYLIVSSITLIHLRLDDIPSKPKLRQLQPQGVRDTTPESSEADFKSTLSGVIIKTRARLRNHAGKEHQVRMIQNSETKQQ